MFIVHVCIKIDVYCIYPYMYILRLFLCPVCFIFQNINKELNVLQQKFDEEMNMYQPERKENHEALKMLKAKISSSSEINERF